MTALIEWEVRIKKVAGPLDDLVTTNWVVSASPDSAVFFGNDIGTIQRIVERAPARVGRVERVARVHHRNNKLWSRDLCNFGIHVLSCDFERRRLG